MRQVAAVERSLDQGDVDYSDILHNIPACRGAMDALMAEVIEGYIRYHVSSRGTKLPTDEQTRAADDLVSARRAYLKQLASRHGRSFVAPN